MIVVDVGCKRHGNEDSIDALVGRYEPLVLFGFDPHPQLQEGVELRVSQRRPGELSVTTVVTRRAAAWTHDGTVLYRQDGTRSRIVQTEDEAVRVASFDLATFIFTLGRVDVLKLDVEGAERRLVPYLRRRSADRAVGTLLVEWHGRPLVTRGAWNVEPWE